MKQSNNLYINKPISAEPFFDTIPNKSFPLDTTFVPLDKSVIWHFNYLFWKYFSLWEKTYDEHYEASLPSGVSESHKDAFIKKSVDKFIRLLLQLEREHKLPEKLCVLEQGPGTGLYAKKFLDHIENNYPRFYKNIVYILTDTSEKILATAKATLRKHKARIQSVILDARNLKNLTFKNQILFARHSNLWDQFPARILVMNNGDISEVLVQAVADKEFNRADRTAPQALGTLPIANPARRLRELLQSKQIEQLITIYPLLWKPLMRSIKFKTKIKKFTQKEIIELNHSQVLQKLATLAVTKQEIIISNGILDNIEQLLKMIDWQRNGYIEIVDIIVPDISGFQKDRRPKKYDGSIATVVNGPLIKAFLQTKQKHPRFEKIRGINYTVTMRNHNLKTLIEAKDFITIGEIAARRDELIEHLKQHAQELFTMGVDVVGFSDQAFVKPEYLSQKEIVDSGIFKKLPCQALMPIVKTRNKTWEEIQLLTNKLKQQGVKNIFVVTGDPGLEKELLYTSIEITQKLKNDFYIGGVVNADVNNIPKTIKKTQAGTKFFIMQATYDKQKFDAWVKEIKRQKIHEQAPIIAAIVPIVSKRTLSVLKFINDMSISNELNKKFEHMDNKTLRHEGIKLAKDMAEQYRQTGIFSGIYIYSKSHEVICEIMGFAYRKSSFVIDSL